MINSDADTAKILIHAAEESLREKRASDFEREITRKILCEFFILPILCSPWGRLMP